MDISENVLSVAENVLMRPALRVKLEEAHVIASGEFSRETGHTYDSMKGRNHVAVQTGTVSELSVLAGLYFPQAHCGVLEQTGQVILCTRAPALRHWESETEELNPRAAGCCFFQHHEQITDAVET